MSLLFLPFASATAVTWIGADGTNGNDWATSTNWNPQIVPGYADDVTVDWSQAKASLFVTATTPNLMINTITVSGSGNGKTFNFTTGCGSVWMQNNLTIKTTDSSVFINVGGQVSANINVETFATIQGGQYLNPISVSSNGELYFDPQGQIVSLQTNLINNGNVNFVSQGVISLQGCSLTGSGVYELSGSSTTAPLMFQSASANGFQSTTIKVDSTSSAAVFNVTMESVSLKIDGQITLSSAASISTASISNGGQLTVSAPNQNLMIGTVSGQGQLVLVQLQMLTVSDQLSIDTVKIQGPTGVFNISAKNPTISTLSVQAPMTIQSNGGVNIDTLNVEGAGTYSGIFNVNNFVVANSASSAIGTNSVITILKNFQSSATIYFQFSVNAVLFFNAPSPLTFSNDAVLTSRPNQPTNGIVKVNGQLTFQQKSSFQSVDLAGSGSIVIGTNGELFYSDGSVSTSNIILTQPPANSTGRSIFDGAGTVTFATTVTSNPSTTIIEYLNGMRQVCNGSCGLVNTKSVGSFSFIVLPPSISSQVHRVTKGRK